MNVSTSKLRLLQCELFEHPQCEIRHSRSLNMRPEKPLPKTGDTVKNEISIKEFTVSQPSPLLVLLLLDASGSMAESGKIEALNRAVEEMLATFASEPEVRAVIQVGAVTFGGDVRVHLPPLPVEEAKRKWR